MKPQNVATEGWVEIAGPNLSAFATTVSHHWLVAVH